ncbi:hypothetical protein J3R83DRAFT_11656 [Lanmaoa asiatica]|nr:hypothetical protein J3R83DRAFT_5855 [Lanmaoa asiatica]KAH0834287.1 hypothetical protein J3R83DRAFT_11656 [Lanmaoa asiatica]
MSNEGYNIRERHESLYFVDGNIVLLASRPDRPALLFRVHKSILSSHSPIFSDMFDVCSPSGITSDGDTDHSYDGVPLIDMPDDANHLESVLKILYYQSPLPWTPRSPRYPALITPILDLSRKYGIDRVREQVLRHLESDWPQTLKDWDKLERDIEFMISDSDVEYIDDYLPEPAAAIKLAYQFDIPSILPSAFYHLSRLSILDDWDKTHADSAMSIRNLRKRTAQWGLLSAKDFHCLLLGKAEFAGILRRCINTGELRHRKVDNGVGRSRDECEMGERLWKDICDRCSESADPLALLKSLATFEGDEAQHCRTCAKALRARIPAVRAEIWKKLGDLFHLKDK